MKYVLSVVLAAFIFTGCGEDEVELVKNYTLPDFKSMSIGTAIEGSKICKNITWSKEENGGLKKTVKMVCDVDTEPIKVRTKELRADGFKSSQKTMINAYLDSVKIFYKGKTYDAQGLFKLAKEHCKLNEAKFQEILKAKGKIEFDDEKKLVDCDSKLEEILKEDSIESDINYVMENLKRSVYNSQLTVEQYYASIGSKAEGNVPSKATIELNFIVNNDKSVSLSDKFKLTEDGKEDTNNKMKSQDLLAGFYERQ